MSVSACCFKGFQWDGTHTGRVDKLASNDVYISGDGKTEAAVLLIHDLYGWTFGNVRLLADHLARETGATVYVPDFFGGTVLPAHLITDGRYAELNLPELMQANSRENREPEVFACARALREHHARVGAVGYCYGGWAVFRLAAREHEPPLIDAAVAAHPSLLTPDDIHGAGSRVPMQILSTEIDHSYNAELKTLTFETLQKSGVPFDFQHFPGVEHGCFIRGDDRKAGERDATARAKNAAADWFRQWL